MPRKRVGYFRYSVRKFLGALLLLFVVSPFVEEMKHGRFYQTLLILLVLISGVLAVGGRRRTLLVGAGLAGVVVLGKAAAHLWPESVPLWYTLVGAFVFVGYVGAHLVHFIMRAPQVNSEVLCSGLAVYLLLGLEWTFLYIIVGQLNPGAFTPPGTVQGYTAFYFSFITLTTVGYGDVMPVSNVARMLTVMEAITGTMYMAVLVARLVSLYTTQQVREEQR